MHCHAKPVRTYDKHTAQARSLTVLPAADLPALSVPLPLPLHAPAPPPVRAHRGPRCCGTSWCQRSGALRETNTQQLVLPAAMIVWLSLWDYHCAPSTPACMPHSSKQDQHNTNSLTLVSVGRLTLDRHQRILHANTPAQLQSLHPQLAPAPSTPHRMVFKMGYARHIFRRQQQCRAALQLAPVCHESPRGPCTAATCMPASAQTPSPPPRPQAMITDMITARHTFRWQ